MATTFQTDRLTPPGVAAGAAYADADAFGQPFSFTVPTSGLIHSAVYYDLDNEGVAMDLLLFDAPPAFQTDNSALSYTDGDLIKCIGRIQFTSFSACANGQIGHATSIGVGYTCATGIMYAQFQARSAPNIAASNIPAVRITILPD